jgi:hypothetical protein
VTESARPCGARLTQRTGSFQQHRRLGLGVGGSMSSSESVRIATPKRVAKMASTQSLNHLLNFTLPPRQTHFAQNFPRRGKKPSSYQPTWNQESKPCRSLSRSANSYRQPEFVNAQFRFMMNPTGDYLRAYHVDKHPHLIVFMLLRIIRRPICGS